MFKWQDEDCYSKTEQKKKKKQEDWFTFELWAQQWAKVVFKTAENTLWQHKMRAGWS